MKENDVKGFRGEELYIYPPDTFLKPILIMSKTRGEFAIRFASALNHFHVLEEGFKKNCSSWQVIQKGETYQFEEWKEKLQKGEFDGWFFYLEIYDKYCPENMRDKG